MRNAGRANIAKRTSWSSSVGDRRDNISFKVVKTRILLYYSRAFDSTQAARDRKGVVAAFPTPPRARFSTEVADSPYCANEISLISNNEKRT